MQDVIVVPNEVAAELAGVTDGVLDSLRDRLGCSISLRGNKLTLDGEGERVAEARAVVDELVELVEGGHAIGPDTVGAVAAALDQAADIRDIFEALYDTMDPDRLTAYMERGTIEVAPLAFMRGRTLNDSFIILDEAQNTTPEQMQMFLTRLGFGSKMVVTGDITQIDLPREQASGLIQVQDILGSIDGIAFVRFTHEDVVRHKLVQRIVEAYKRHTEETGTQRRR